MHRGETRGGVFLLGLAAGVAAGVAGGLWLLRPQGEDVEIVVREDREAGSIAGRSPAVRRGASTAPVQRPPSFLEQLQQRWDQAMREGHKAAAARRAELERKLAGDRKEVAVDLLTASRIDEVTEKLGEISGDKGPESQPDTGPTSEG